MLVLGPDSSISPPTLAAIVPLLAGGDAGTASVLAGMLARFVGLVEIGLGLGKLGFVADLLSKEVQVGYMNGLGITIIVGQLPKLLGFSTGADNFPDELKQIAQGLDRTDTTTLLVGAAVLAVLLVLPGQEPGDQPRRSRTGRGAPAVPELAARRPPADGARRGVIVAASP